MSELRLAALPTPLEPGPVLPGGARLWVKRDDLTGLGGGGNKARKLEPLCAAAQAEGADVLVTVGGAQSNHCRMTAAAGARLGWPVHLVLGGARPPLLAGNQAIAALFGAELHFAGSHDWADLAAASERVAADLRAAGRRPYLVPIGGSTPVGASAFANAFDELLDQLDALGWSPARVESTTVVHTSSSGGTHAGLVAGRARARATGRAVPSVVAVAVAKGVAVDPVPVGRLAELTLAHLGSAVALQPGDVVVDDRWLGPDYEVPTPEGDEAITWAARHGGWLLDRTYTGKGLAGLLGRAREGALEAGADAVFWHTGGWPALFAPGGWPEPSGGPTAAR